jgi:hypothetical protein
MFFDSEKVVSIDHVLPRIPPQIHHDLPPRCTTKSAKPPAKTALAAQEKIISPTVTASDV